ncbi:MAG: siroheme synthase CysG [Gammaproteobacteria bacterium]
MSYLPIFLKSQSFQQVLVVGGGEIAQAKSETLMELGFGVRVITLELSKSFEKFCLTHGVRTKTCHYSEKELASEKIVVAATENKKLNAQIAFDCRQRGILVNVVDNPKQCDFIFPALIKRGPLQIAISTSGISPVLARIIKQKIEQLIPSAYEKLIDFLNDKKKTIRDALSNIQPRRLFYESLLESNLPEELFEGNFTNANQLFFSRLNASPDKNIGALYLIGAGPGHPDLITVKAARLIGKADIILYDRLIPLETIGQYARKDAVKVLVGKTRDRHLKSQDEINNIIKEHLGKNKIVVRLKGGDPGVYGHGAEEIEIAKQLGATYQIIPGISAMNGCAAYTGIPLTERGGANSFRALTLYQGDFENEAIWKTIDPNMKETLIVYMSTKYYFQLCEKLLAIGFPNQTPILVVEQGTTDYQRSYSYSLEEFINRNKNKQFISPSLMYIGGVTKWHSDHGWREEHDEAKEYFPKLLGGSVHAQG